MLQLQGKKLLTEGDQWGHTARDLCVPQPRLGLVHGHLLLFNHGDKQPDNSLQVFVSGLELLSHVVGGRRVSDCGLCCQGCVSDQGRVGVSLVVSLLMVSLTPHPGATGKSLKLWSWHDGLTPGMGSSPQPRNAADQSLQQPDGLGWEGKQWWGALEHPSLVNKRGRGVELQSRGVLCFRGRRGSTGREDGRHVAGGHSSTCT